MTAGKRAKSLGHLEITWSFMSRIYLPKSKLVNVLIPSPAGKISVSFKPGIARRKRLHSTQNIGVLGVQLLSAYSTWTPSCEAPRAVAPYKLRVQYCLCEWHGMARPAVALAQSNKMLKPINTRQGASWQESESDW